MKRLGNLFDKICTIENIELADRNARRGKHNYGITKHDKHAREDNEKLLEALKNGTLKTSKYSTFKIYEPKERVIYRLPYYPDRIIQWAIMNVMEPIWVSSFIEHTYSCIKGRGIHKLVKDLSKTLQKDRVGTTYCLKMDIKKFYPSIDHDILKRIIRKSNKDKRLLFKLDEIIDSADGVPIGNYLSQFFANLYLTPFDHWLLEQVKVKYYFRYADDMVILSDNKEFLKKILILVKIYLKHELKLELKSNWQIFMVEDRGIDFVGYKFFHSYTLLRKSVKKNIHRLVHKYSSKQISEKDFKKRITAYYGWMKYCNSKHLLQKIEKDTGMHFSNWNGIQSIISNFYGKTVKVIEVVPYSKYFQLHFVYKDKPFSVCSRNKIIYRLLFKKPSTDFKILNYGRTA